MTSVDRNSRSRQPRQQTARQADQLAETTRSAPQLPDKGTLYPQTIDAALPDRDRVAHHHAKLEEAGVKYILSCWVDLLGIPKTKPVPLSEFPALCAGKGPQFAVHSVSMVPELGPADPDQIPIPDLDSLVICPWNRTYAWVFADLFFEGSPYAVCPRLALKKVIKNAADAGYRFFAGMEPEFMLMRYTHAGWPIKAVDDDPVLQTAFRPKRQPFGYDAEFSLDGLPLLTEIIQYIQELDWELKNVVCEGAYSQFELDFGYTDILAMADRFCFLRVMLKEIAKQHGLFATYMPKPTQGDWRNGAHINHSVQALNRPAENLFENPNGGWSEAAYHALSGLMNHGGAIAAITCSTINSYKGLIGRARDFEGGTVTWAPTHICYGENNRSAMFRLPQSRRAIENRAVDMCVNPYLGLALTAAATVEGLNARTHPGDAINQSLYDTTPAELEAAGAKPLPGNLLDAIRLFDEDPLAKQTLGLTMHGLYSRYKHKEWERFHQHITEWERQEYLRFF